MLKKHVNNTNQYDTFLYHWRKNVQGKIIMKTTLIQFCNDLLFPLMEPWYF